MVMKPEEEEKKARSQTNQTTVIVTMVAMDIPVFINFVFYLLLNFDAIEETTKTKVAMIA